MWQSVEQKQPEQPQEVNGSVFRDDGIGARMRRDRLLTKRCIEYAQLSHAIRRVYVRRVARIAVGLTGVLGAMALLGAANSQPLYYVIESLIPGPKPAVLATVLLSSWVLSILAYFVGRAIGEEHYAYAISQTVVVSHDPFGDVDRLTQVGPNHAARQLANKVMDTSVWLPIMGGALMVFATSIFVVAGLAKSSYGFITSFEVLAPGWLNGVTISVLSSILVLTLIIHRRLLRSQTSGELRGCDISCAWAIMVGGWVIFMPVLSLIAPTLMLHVAAVTAVLVTARRVKSCLSTENAALGMADRPGCRDSAA